MRRQLILTSQVRGHPIRATVRNARALERKRQDDGDLKLFVVSFTAFFVCFSTFLM
jgi:hypothetical protein